LKWCYYFFATVYSSRLRTLLVRFVPTWTAGHSDYLHSICEIVTFLKTLTFFSAGGAGVAQDTSALMEVTRAQLELHRMNTGFRKVPVRCANQMVRQLLYRFSGNMQANVIIGGVDRTGTHLFCTRFDGTTDTVPFTSLGSGNLAAMSMLESRWTEGLDEQAAHDLACDAVFVGMENDLNSGGRACLCIIRSDFSVHWKVQSPYPNKTSPMRSLLLAIRHGCTSVLSTIEHQVVPWGETPAGCKASVSGPGGRMDPGPGETGNRRRGAETLGPPKAKRRRLDADEPAK